MRVDEKVGKRKANFGIVEIQCRIFFIFYLIYYLEITLKVISIFGKLFNTIGYIFLYNCLFIDNKALSIYAIIYLLIEVANV